MAPSGAPEFYCNGFECSGTQGTDTSTSASFWTGPLTLPTSSTGQYTITLTNAQPNTGVATFALYSVPANVSASTTIGATGSLLTTTVPGQSAQIQFSATSGSSFTFNITAVGQTNCDTATILEPDGQTVLAQSGICGTSGSLNSGTLQSSGTYTAVVTPGGPATGNYTLGATSP